MSFFKNLKKRLGIVLFLLILLVALPVLSVQASVSLLYFRAVAGPDSITLEWETAQELDNFGFNLYRGLTDVFDDAQKLNNGVIPSQGGVTGAFYEWPDNNVDVGVEYTYWLEDIDTNGNSTVHDPVTASTIGGNTIPTVPVPGGNSTDTPTPTRTPTRTPNPTTQSGPTATPTRTPTRTPTTQPISSNPTATTASQTQATAASNNVQPTSALQSNPISTPEPENEEPAQLPTDDPELTPESATNTSVSSVDGATPRALVAQAPTEPETNSDNQIGQQIGQNSASLQSEASLNPNNRDDSNRSTILTMALIVSIILLIAGGGGIIVLFLNRNKQPRV